MSDVMNVSRRGFLKVAGITGGGLVMGFSLTGCGAGPAPISSKAGELTPNSFIQITPDNIVRFFCPRDEMGQGVTTGLATLIAEELDTEPSDIDVHFAGVHKDYDNPEFSVQGTGGSTSIKVHYLPLRQVAANTRGLLLEAASSQLGVAKSELTTNNRQILANGESYPYSDFIAKAAQMTFSGDAPLKAKADFKYIGKEFARIDAQAKSTGTAIYGADVDIDDMHHAVVLRSPVAGGKLVSFDAAQSLASPGVTDVIEIDAGVAIVAKQFWQAKKARDMVKAEWDLPELANFSSADIKADYQAAMNDEEGSAEAERGDFGAAYESASHTINHEYWAPYLSHAPMEPMNAVVRIDGDSAEVWSGVQFPGVAQGLVARYAGLSTGNVTMHNTYLGGGFGRRGMLTHVAEAAQTAVLTGKPIQVMWTREDDIRHGFYRPASLMRIQAGVDDTGKISAWSAKRVGGNIMPDLLVEALPGMAPILPKGITNMVAGAADTAMANWFVEEQSIEGLFEDYDFPNREVHHVTKNHGLPLLFWRSVGHSFTAFAKETAIDELASKAGVDAIDLRLRNTQDNPRLNNVIKVAGEKMQSMASATGKLGFAAHKSFNSYVAQVADVSVGNGKIKVNKVICVVDCGQVINPDIVRGQMEGAIMYGLTAALYGDTQIENGQVKESNFHDYPILRMNEAPAVEVVIIDSDEAPTGVGEPGLPPIAPAVANAVYSITGHRLRSLPLKLS